MSQSYIVSSNSCASLRRDVRYFYDLESPLTTAWIIGNPEHKINGYGLYKVLVVATLFVNVLFGNPIRSFNIVLLVCECNCRVEKDVISSIGTRKKCMCVQRR